MCGRYTLSLSVDELWEDLELDGEPGAGVWSQDPSETLRPRFNIAPTQVAPVVTDRSPEKIVLLKWGLVPFWADDPKSGAKLINVRSESIHEKPSFRKIFDERRCLVPADAFYEWKRGTGKDKTPMAVRLPSRGIFTFAGLWSSWRSKANPDTRVVTYGILTTPSPAPLRTLHSRMPVIVARSDRRAWLDRQIEPGSLLPLLRPFAEPLDVYEVSSRVGSHVNDDADLLAPVSPAGT